MQSEPNLSANDLIYLFLDGETNQAQESALFGRLGADTSLQQEFREAVRIRAAVEAEKNTVVPPAALTKKIFASAGIATGAMGLLGGTSYTAASIVAPVVSSIVLGATLASLFFLSVRPGANETNSWASVGSSPARIHMTVPAAQREQGLLADDLGQSRLSKYRPGITRHSPANVDVSGLPTGLWASDLGGPSGPATSLDLSSAPVSLAQVSDVVEVTKRSQQSFAPVSFADNSPNFSEPSTLSIQFRGLQSVSNFPTLYRSPEASGMQNLSFAAFYRVGDNLDLGLELGSEAFNYYVFNGGFGERRNTLRWASLAVRHDMQYASLASGLRPFAQVNLGITSVGPLARLFSGLAYSPNRALTLSAGLEGMGMWYRNSAGLFNSQSLVFSYGMMYSF